MPALEAGFYIERGADPPAMYAFLFYKLTKTRKPARISVRNIMKNYVGKLAQMDT